MLILVLNKFFLIIGTLDAVACGENFEFPQRMIDEIFRVTKKYFFLISHSGREKRNFFFRNFNSSAEIQVKVNKKYF